MQTIKEDNDQIREVSLTGLKPSDGVDAQGVDYSLVLHVNEGDSLTVKVGLYRNHADKGKQYAQIELEQCMAKESVPRGLIDSEVVQWIHGERGNEGLYEHLLVCLAAPASKLEIQAVDDGVRFTLTVGSDYRSEATVELEKLAHFLQAV